MFPRVHTKCFLSEAFTLCTIVGLQQTVIKLFPVSLASSSLVSGSETVRTDEQLEENK